MGWWTSIFGSATSGDALGTLDPKLREFLEKESPVKYSPSPPPSPAPGPEAPPKEAAETASPETDKAKVPAASLYQDGRYAHLWKSYRPLAQIEAESATDHDKLTSVLEGYKSRKAAIGRAALENCALQQEEWVNCMKSGSWEDQLQMCRHQVRRFERCYSMQARFLRALGYGSVLERPPEVDEDIQMHADSLFQRMLKHEAAVEQAKQDGTPIPVFEVSLPRAPTSAAAPPRDLANQWRQGLEKLPAEERAVEEAALRADYEEKTEVATQVQKIWKSQQDARDERKAQGQATLSDAIAALWGRATK